MKFLSIIVFTILVIQITQVYSDETKDLENIITNLENIPKVGRPSRRPRPSTLDVDFLRVLGGCSKPRNFDKCSLFVEELDSFLSNDQALVGSPICVICKIGGLIAKPVESICKTVCGIILG
jgi:hypothetical protein